jgi:hypothetical protein
MLRESIAEFKTCCAGNQEETTNEQVEISKLKLENLQLQCAKNEVALNLEIKALKQENENLRKEIVEKKGIEIQLKGLEKKFDQQVEKLDSLMYGA